MLEIEEFDCNICGGRQLVPEKESGFYHCANCGRKYHVDAIKKEIEALKQILNEDSRDKINTCKSEIWQLLKNEYVDSEKIIGFADIIINQHPNDFWGKFYKFINEENAEPVCQLISSVNVEAQNEDLDEIFRLLLRLYTPETDKCICELARRAYAEKAPETFRKYTDECNRLHTLFSTRVYEPTEKRSIFLCYDAQNAPQAETLTEHLEKKGYTCYLEKRNFFRGKNSAKKRQGELLIALEHCDYFLLLSTERARDISDNNMYFILRQLGSRTEKSPVCIEYLQEEYTGKAGESFIKSVFADENRVYKFSEIIDRLFESGEKEVVLNKDCPPPPPPPPPEPEETVVCTEEPKTERETRAVERGQHIIFPKKTEEIIFSVRSAMTVSNLVPNLFAFLLSENNFVTEETNLVFYNNEQSSDGSVQWVSDGIDASKLIVHTEKISPNVRRIRIAYAFSERDVRGNFSMVDGTETVVSAQNTDFVYSVSEKGTFDSVFLAEFYRIGEEWRMTVLCEPSESIDKVCWVYGIDVE